jgi:hypothetical protein
LKKIKWGGSRAARERNLLPDALDCANTTANASFQIAFPDRDISPSLTVQLRTMPSVSFNISLNLVFPVPHVRRRHPRPRTPVPVPEAAIHKHRDPLAREHNIRVTSDFCTMRRKAQPCLFQCFNYFLLWFSVARHDPRHNPASRLGVECVHHLQIVGNFNEQ